MLKHAIALTALLAACGEHTSPVEHDAPAAAPDMPAGHEMPAPADAKAGMDQMFIDMMVPHHQGALDMAKIAQERAEHPELKAMAAGMLTSQQAEIDQLKSWRKAWFGSDQVPPMAAHSGHADMPGMKGMGNMQADIEKLKTATPFDLAFFDAMIPHHQGAVDMVAAIPGERPEVKQLSAKIVADQQKEIAQMQEWRKAWYPDANAPATH